MASLNQLVSEFAHAVGNPNSIPLRRNLRYAILHGRNELIRKSYENHKYVDKGLQQRIRVSIVNVPDGDLYNSQTLGLPAIKRTKQEVPKPVRLINNLPFQSIRTTGHTGIEIPFAKEAIPGSTGYYREDTLKWLDEKLTKNEKKSVIIFQHFPVIYPDGVDLKTHKTYRVEDYKEVLAKHNNVLAIITGHFHTNSETMENGVYHISSPSILSIPQSYKVIDIVTTKDFSPIIYSQLREFKVEE